MEKQAYNSKNFIKNRSSFQDFQCGICFDLSNDLVKCKGPCQKVFCLDCVSKAKNVTDRCPNRCSKPFFAAKLPKLKFQFNCPYSPQCQTSITTVDAFEQHPLICSYTPPSQKLKHRLKKQYKCPQQHNLQFFIGKYNEMVFSICAQCQQQKLCRSICRKCDEKYCIQCRMPPCSKKGCPIGHDFALLKDWNLQYICDVCGMNACIFNTGIYDDKECNFGICENCIEKLPLERDNHQFVRLVNNQERCQCGTKLTYPGAEQIKNECCMCGRNKNCPKSCLSCHLNFCLKCKSISIYGDICQFQHKLQLIFTKNQEESACIRCDKSATVYMHDSICGVKLCLECTEYFKSISMDKQRLRPVYCDQGHKLCFLKECKRNCKKCKKNKDVQLICLQCEGKDVYYCYQCKPISLEACYLEHPLTLNETIQTARNCSICKQEHIEYKSCKKCKFYVCQGCFNASESQTSLIPSLSQLAIQ